METINKEEILSRIEQREKKARVRGWLLILVPLVMGLGIIAYTGVQLRNLSQVRRLYAGAETELSGAFGSPHEAAVPVEQFSRESRERVLSGTTGRRGEALELAFALYDQHVPFKWGGKTPSDGLDTSGFVAYILGQVGVLPNPEQYWSGALRKRFQVEVSNPAELRPGDLIFEEDKACWFVLNEQYAIGMIPDGIQIGEPKKFSSKIVGYGKVPYEAVNRNH
jgi:hypothetical protein